jgi:hypothetical protein
VSVTQQNDDDHLSDEVNGSDTLQKRRRSHDPISLAIDAQQCIAMVMSEGIFYDAVFATWKSWPGLCVASGQRPTNHDSNDSAPFAHENRIRK